MTECERLIKEGIISSDFLKEEVRDDYLVTTETKKVWAISIDLLERLVEVCQKNGLKVFAAYGTLLGAARHKGFIPWDDDLDVWMPREDYEKLIRIASDCFSEPYFFQTTDNDVEYYSAFARLRNSQTTGLLVSHKSHCNNGIYIDIFPLDGLSNNVRYQKVKNHWVHFLNVLSHAYAFNINPSLITRTIHQILRLPFIPFNLRRVCRYVNRISQRKETPNEKYCGCVAFPEFPYKKNCFEKADFKDVVYLPFEHIKIPAPAGFKNVLTANFGDYMQFPPINQRGLHHSFIFEPDIPYKEYMKSILNK